MRNEALEAMIKRAISRKKKSLRDKEGASTRTSYLDAVITSCKHLIFLESSVHESDSQCSLSASTKGSENGRDLSNVSKKSAHKVSTCNKQNLKGNRGDNSDNSASNDDAKILQVDEIGSRISEITNFDTQSTRSKRPRNNEVKILNCRCQSLRNLDIHDAVNLMKDVEWGCIDI
jgi:hypothetical protein